MKEQRKQGGGLARVVAIVALLARALLVLAVLGSLWYGFEGIRPRLGYLAVGALLWWELRRAYRPREEDPTP